MGGSTGKILGTIAAVTLAPVTGGASLALAGLAGAAAGELLVDKPAREAEKAATQAAAATEQARQDALAQAQASQSEMQMGVGKVESRGTTSLGEEDAEDKRGTIKKKKLGASKLRIDPLASTGTAATGTATTGTTGLKV